MSKEFQIRDGNLIASFDLENEDGDIDFCKLLKVSTGVACINTNRNFIGIELASHYFEIAKERIEKAQHEDKGE